MANKYQSNERYYPQNNYSLDYITAARAFNNPWQALGALVGNALIKNYVNRGEEKLEKSLENSIPTGEAPTDAQVTQQMIQNAQAQAPTREEQVQDNIFNKYKQSNPIEINPQQMSNIGLEALKNQTADPIETAALQGAIDKANGNVQASQVTPNENIAFQEYLKNNAPHMDASGNLSNMDAAANLQAQKQQATAQVAENNMRPFSVEDWEAQVWAEGRKQGRPDYQIQAVIDRMKPQAEAAERKYNDYRTSEIEKTMFSNIDDPTVTLASLAEMYKYNPEKAAIYAKGITTPKEQRYQQNQLERAYIGNAGRKGNSAASGTNYDWNSGYMPASAKEKQWALRQQVKAGIKTQDEANKEWTNFLGTLGQTADEKKASKETQGFLDKINPYVQKIMALNDDYDVEGSGNALSDLQVAIQENPDLWNNLPQNTKNEVIWQMYNANALREAMASDDPAQSNKYRQALTAEVNNAHGWGWNAADKRREYLKRNPDK